VKLGHYLAGLLLAYVLRSPAQTAITDPMVKHVVLLRIRRDVSPSTISRLFAEIAALRDKIPGIRDFSWGPYSSPEGLNRGFTHGFVMTFADEASRDAYLPHPEHERVKTQILAVLDGGLDAAVAFDWVDVPA
jgi:hypothetical protein